MSKLATEAASGYQPVRAPRGSALSCKGWQQEAALRMLMNNLDPEVAEKPEDLIVYGGRARPRATGIVITRSSRRLRSLENDETLLVQSGKPVGIFRTHSYAPRVLIANSNLVGHWSDWKHFDELDRAGLMMYGQMTAGSWIYIGSQGILQGTYETFAAAARKHFGGDLAGKLVVTGGMGGMGGAQPLAATLNGAAFLGIDVDPERIKRRVENGLLRRDGQRSGRSSAHPEKCRAQTRSHFGRTGWQLRGRDSGTRAPRRGARSAHGSNQRSRSHRRIHSTGPRRRASRRTAQVRSRRLRKAFPGFHRAPRGRHARAAKNGRGNFRLRQQHPHLRISARREERLRFSRLRARLHSSAFLRRPRAVPLGGAFRRAFRYSPHRPAGAGNVSARRDSLALDQARAEARAIPGTARAHLLARLWRTRPLRRGAQRSGGARRTERPHRDRPRSSGLRLGRFALTAKPKKCRMARTPSPIGRCSMRC